MENTEVRHKIEIHGLKSHHGTLRAKLCMRYLRKYMKHLYERPVVRVYYDSGWVEYVNRIIAELGAKYRRLNYLKNPVIVFLDGKYIGDHRALIQHLTYEHGIIPDLPFPDLFLDFTSFLPKRKNKEYVYLDIRVGDLNDYVVGKMVFELHKDITPETCKLFSYLCDPFGPHQFSKKEPKSKVTYLGSTIRRICGKSFIQGGVVSEAKLFRVNDENFTMKHDRRGVLSLANQGRNRSTTEFVISLQPNPWMDGINVAFGRLIFGESLLEAIEEEPTYYQSPLQDIVVVGCGVIPNEDLRANVGCETKILKMKKKNINEVIETKREKLEEIVAFEKKLIQLLKRNEKERKCELIYRETSDTSSRIEISGTEDEWLREEGLTEEASKYLEEKSIGEERNEEINAEEEIDNEFIADEEILKGTFYEETKFNGDFKTNELTLAEILRKSKKKYEKLKTNMMIEFIHSILKKVFLSIKSDDDSIQLDDIQVPEIEDVIDVRDVPSDPLLDVSYYRGQYSLPNSLRESLVDAFNNLSPAKLKLLGIEARAVLEKGGIPEESLQIYSSEDMISGIMMAVINIGLIKHGRVLYQPSNSQSVSDSSISIKEVGELVEEICEDTIKILKTKDPDFIRSSLVEKEGSVKEEACYEEEHVFGEDVLNSIDDDIEELNLDNALEEHHEEFLEEEEEISEVEIEGLE